MPSQRSQNFSSSPLCIPLSKFSYAALPNETIGPIPWIHLSSKHCLFAIFENSPTQLGDGRVEERQRFKVLQDPEVMEELDVNALSVGAHRALDQVSKGQVPLVAVVVKVPNIAIKYPMTNGQIKRFQIRFTCDEDYYEAMKMFSRANVPMVEAGSYPVLKPKTAPRPASSTLLAPSDSVSQIRLPSKAQTSCSTGPTDSVANGSKLGISSLYHPPPASKAQSTMLPPNHLPERMDSAPYRPPGQPTVIEQWQVRQASNNQQVGPRSNISLSMATTLVPAGEQRDPGVVAVQSEASGDVSHLGPQMVDHARQKTDQMAFHLAAPAPVKELDVDLILPPKRELPFRRTGSRTRDKATSSTPNQDITEQDEKKKNPAGPEADDLGSVAEAGAKGKRKQSSTKTEPKTPAVKKSRTTTARKRGRGKICREETPVPTVEELLRQPGNHLLRRISQQSTKIDARKRKAEVGQKKSTEISIPESLLPSQEESSHPASPSLGGTMRMTRSISRSLACVSKQENEKKDLEPKKGPPRAPADYVIAPLTTQSARPDTDTSRPQMNNTNADQTHNTESFSCAGPPSAHASCLDSLISQNTQSYLESDPQFANSRERLQSWSDMPAQTRNPALRSYFCCLLMDPNFISLCKAVDGFWERVLLEPRLKQ
ncbi:uncharacterized protein Z518_07281 [Rhinocladiella mackenziei CBS 650.93]|uniref:Uncharacterized protein n=1 Tax=Rhinocladiella mackenziei CBS 650.93 TaxID=1442369 RepID=A0A0D2GZV1_9EURO|nr:uncharacterized protein Z518_07281 [Rhinocladiella mackenziei CBS 650.93]KIX03728.1 hypothetical protein Z518_07281 [Rhinocladiella mackenziei CBS 650.93]